MYFQSKVCYCLGKLLHGSTPYYSVCSLCGKIKSHKLYLPIFQQKFFTLYFDLQLTKNFKLCVLLKQHWGLSDQMIPILYNYHHCLSCEEQQQHEKKGCVNKNTRNCPTKLFGISLEQKRRHNTTHFRRIEKKMFSNYYNKLIMACGYYLLGARP